MLSPFPGRASFPFLRMRPPSTAYPNLTCTNYKFVVAEIFPFSIFSSARLSAQVAPHKEQSNRNKNNSFLPAPDEWPGPTLRASVKDWLQYLHEQFRNFRPGFAL